MQTEQKKIDRLKKKIDRINKKLDFWENKKFLITLAFVFMWSLPAFTMVTLAFYFNPILFGILATLQFGMSASLSMLTRDLISKRRINKLVDMRNEIFDFLVETQEKLNEQTTEVSLDDKTEETKSLLTELAENKQAKVNGTEIETEESLIRKLNEIKKNKIRNNMSKLKKDINTWFTNMDPESRESLFKELGIDKFIEKKQTGDSQTIDHKDGPDTFF